LKWDPAKWPGIRDILVNTTLDAASRHPDLILWPESATQLAVRGDENGKALVEAIVKKANAPLLLGSIAIENAGTPNEAWFNGTFLVTPEEGVAKNYYAKRQLVPFGEFVPFRPLLGWLKKFVPIGEGDFSHGETSAPLLVPLHGQIAVVGPLICYEDIFPTLSRLSAVAGANLLVVVTNNGWFGEGGAAYQHAAHSVLRAVETRRPVLRCGNAGWSGWIDEFGNVRTVVTNSSGTIYFRGTKTVDVTRDARWVDKNSFYTEHGDWFVLVCATLVTFAFALLKMAEMTAAQTKRPESAG
jgi:apolipoprotein N-acyltransferase